MQEWLEDELHPQYPDAYNDFFDVWQPLFKQHGPIEVGLPHWEGVGKDLGEIKWGPPNCRIYCSIESGQRLVMYLGRIKTWRTFENADRKLCNQRRADFLSKDYDQQKRKYLYQALCQRRARNGSA